MANDTQQSGVPVKARLPYIDFMKGMCIILIVGGHVYPDLYPGRIDSMLQSFRVPLYYFLSGLFFKSYGGFGDFTRRKVNNILVPFVFFYLSVCALALVMTHVLHLDRAGVISDPFEWEYVLDPLLVREFHYSVALWFLLSLFWVNIIYYALQHWLPTRWVYVSVVLLSVAGWVLCAFKIVLPVMLDTSLVGLPFFALGSAMKRRGALEPHPLDRWGALAFAAVLVLLYFFARPLNIFDQVLPGYLVMYTLTFLAIVTLFWFAKSLPRIPVVNYIGQFSLIVLGTHSLILTPVRKLVAGVAGDSYWTYWVALALVMALELLIIPVVKYLFPRFTAQKELFRARRPRSSRV